MRRMALEGAARGSGRPAQWPSRLAARLLRRPAERAIFQFVGQTVARENRYQAYLAMYGGVGLALVIACAVGIEKNGLTLSDEGLHATMPLLLFWVIAGLRTAFGFPLHLVAGWVFRVTGVDWNECAAGARTWVLVTSLGVECSVLGLLALAGWDGRRLLVQAVCGGCLCVLLTNGFHSDEKRVPFNRLRMPGRTSLPLMLTLYVGVFPMYVYGIINAEAHWEAHPWKLAMVILGTAAIHTGVKMLRSGPAENEAEMEGYEDEFQILGLS